MDCSAALVLASLFAGSFTIAQGKKVEQKGLRWPNSYGGSIAPTRVRSPASRSRYVATMERLLGLVALVLALAVAMTFLAPRGQRLEMWRGILSTRWTGHEPLGPRRSMTPDVRARYDRPQLGPPLVLEDFRAADQLGERTRVADPESRRVGVALDVDGTCVTTWLAPARDAYEVATQNHTGLANVVHRAEGSRFHLGGASIDRGVVAWWEFDDAANVARLLRRDRGTVVRELAAVPYSKGSTRDPGSVHGEVLVAGDVTVAALTMRGDGCVLVGRGAAPPVSLGHTFVEALRRDLAAEKQGRRQACVNLSIDGKDGHGEVATLDLDTVPPRVTRRRRGVARGATIVDGDAVGMHARSSEIEGPNGLRIVTGYRYAPRDFESDGEYIAFNAAVLQSANGALCQPILLHSRRQVATLLSPSAMAGALLRGEYVMWTEREPEAVLLADPHDSARGVFVATLKSDGPDALAD